MTAAALLTDLREAERELMARCLDRAYATPEHVKARSRDLVAQFECVVTLGHRLARAIDVECHNRERDRAAIDRTIPVPVPSPRADLRELLK
jgi:hypothetical protein